ncbi:MAG: DUF1559 domain-containing protein, partial [Planctomycetaceae bacterium]|nr:DUF1559 domain-containing protein [Planctomycetaceae bacterium]
NDKSPDYWNGPNNGFYAARSSHTGGVNAGLGDGSVRFVNETINLEAWRAVNTIRGGETASF